jgi:hypothetical protein
LCRRGEQTPYFTAGLGGPQVRVAQVQQDELRALELVVLIAMNFVLEVVFCSDLRGDTAASFVKSTHLSF